MNKQKQSGGKFLLILSGVFISLSLSAQTILWTGKANPLNLSVNQVAFSSNGTKIISGTDCHPATIRIYSTSGNVPLWDYTVGSNFMCIMGVAFTADARFIAAIEEFGNVLIFDNSGNVPVLKDTIVTGSQYAFATAVSPSDSLIAVACSNGKVLTYNLNTGAPVADIQAHLVWTTTVAFSPDGKYIVTGSSDNRVKIWNNAGVLLYTCSGHSADVKQVKVSHDSKMVASASEDGKVRIWNIETGESIRILSAHTDVVNGVAWSPDNRYLVSASSDGTCKIWDVSSGKVLASFSQPGGAEFKTADWSPDGHSIVSGTITSDITLWDVSLTGIKTESSNARVSVYPNPVSDYLNFELAENYSINRVILTDAQGRIVFTSGLQTQGIYTGNLTAGFYTLQLFTSTGQAIIKSIIKQ